MNFNELITNLPGWAFSDSEDQRVFAPQFIRRAEQRLFRDLERDAFKVEIAGTLTAGSRDLDLRTFNPVDIRRIKIIVEGQDVVLLHRNLEFLEALFNDNTRLGQPSHYAETAIRSFYTVFVTPEVSWQWNAIIVRPPPFISVGNPTSILTDRFSNLIDLEVWRQAARFKRDFDTADRFEQDYVIELQLANADIRRDRRDESEPRPRETNNSTGS